MRKYLLILFVPIWFQACNNDEPASDNFHGLDNFNRTIRFTVKNVYSLSPVMDSLVPDAQISIYSDYYDFLAGNYPDASRITDSAGYAEINGLDKDFYYIRATHPDLGEIIDSISTPDGTISFEELLFYQ